MLLSVLFLMQRDMIPYGRTAENKYSRVRQAEKDTKQTKRIGATSFCCPRWKSKWLQAQMKPHLQVAILFAEMPSFSPSLLPSSMPSHSLEPELNREERTRCFSLSEGLKI